jgi:hypothetical protein
MTIATILEWTGCAFGLLGSGLLAMNNRLSGWGFVAFFISNAFWIAFGILTNAFGLIAMQVGFTATSLIGIRNWLLDAPNTAIPQESHPPQPAQHTKRNGTLTRHPRGPVLMLDFDGVLHPAQSGSLVHLRTLESWLREHPMVDVVISSNWRDTHTLDGLLAYFSVDIRPRIIGTTPSLQGACREDEILTLVHEYRIDRWAALDDREQEFPRTAATHLVATEYLDGLTEKNLMELTARIEGVA